jgi:MFS superfamily sulfate permease-like transporter
MVGVLVFGILPGLILAVTLSLLGLLLHAKDPHTAILGKIPDENVYASLERFPEGETTPGLTIFRFDEQLFFANAANFRMEARHAVAQSPHTLALLVDAEAINDIDVTALDMLGDLQEELAAAGVDMNIARMRSHVKEYLTRAGIDDQFDFYSSVQAGVDAFVMQQDREDKANEAASIDD